MCRWIKIVETFAGLTWSEVFFFLISSPPQKRHGILTQEGYVSGIHFEVLLMNIYKHNFYWVKSWMNKGNKVGSSILINDSVT